MAMAWACGMGVGDGTVEALLVVEGVCAGFKVVVWRTHGLQDANGRRICAKILCAMT